MQPNPERHVSPKLYAVKIEQLPHEVDETTLQSIFGRYGIIKTMKLNRTSDAFNFAYVNYTNEKDAVDAVKGCNDLILVGTHIKVRLNTTVGLKPHVQHRGEQQTQQSVPTSTQYTVKVTRLPPRVTESDLVGVFTSCGAIKSIKLINQPKASSNYAYVNYTNPEDARRAVEKLNESIFSGRPISVKLHQSSDHKAVQDPPPVIKSSASIDHKELSPKQLTSVTIKVSIPTNDKLSITPEDLCDIFSRYGTITQHPVIIPGIPPYTYINFKTPEEARAACEMDQQIVRTHYIKVKVVDKQIENFDLKEIPCSSLIGKLLFYLYKIELHVLHTPDEVSVKPNKMYTAIKISGKADQIGAVEKKVRSLVEKIKNNVTKEVRSLQHFHLPSFGNHQVADMIKKIEDENYVIIQVVNCNENPLNAEDVVKQISLLQPNPGKEAIETSQLSTFLHTIPSKPLPLPCTPKMKVPLESLPKLPSPTSGHSFAAQSQKYVWFWENDNNGYSLYADDLTAKLTENFISSPKSSFPLSNTYWIDLAQMTQTNLETEKKRKIKLDVQQMSETAAQALPTSTQGDSTKSALPIQPVRHVSATRQLNIHIEIEGLKSHIDASFDALSYELYKYVTESKCNLDKANLIADYLLGITDCYCVEAQVDKTDLLIKGNKEYVNKVRLVVQKEYIEFLKDKVIDRPPYWVSQSEKVVLITIAQSSHEWSTVVQLMHKTLPAARVITLQRIQNEWLWDRYALAKQRMLEKYGEMFVNENEKRLFHGTGTTPPEKIYRSETGFDFRFSSDDNLWGAGTYFAVNASYSERYVHRSPQYQVMIVATVLTGETCMLHKPDRTLKKPPPKQQFEGELYDSVKGHSKGSDIFVIYDHEKAYPAYLITYR